MILRYYDHSFFTITLESGKVIAFDPYNEFYGYPRRQIHADVCLVSHHHFDHDGIAALTGGPTVIDQPGIHRPLPGVAVIGTETKHDEQGGKLRGANTVFTLEAEGLRIVHCGDLGHVPTQMQAMELSQPDLLLIPVGGFYTIDAETAEKTRKLLNPTVTIPMHYRTEYNPEMTVATRDEYLNLTGAEDSQCPLLRITAQDIGQRPAIVTMKIL